MMTFDYPNNKATQTSSSALCIWGNTCINAQKCTLTASFNVQSVEFYHEQIMFWIIETKFYSVKKYTLTC